MADETLPSKSRVYVSLGFLYGDGAVRNATVAEQTLGDEIVRLTRELEVQKGVVDMAYIPHRHLVEQRDRADSEFKNFHRLLCERFRYGHDERDWRRDQLSLIEHIANRPAPETDEGFQARVHDWMAKCFVRPDAMLPAQRSFRFIEEALELVQASGTSREDVLRLVEYVYGRPPGVIGQEIGGAMVTLSGLATSFGLSMEYAGNAELARCDENTEKIRAKDLAKPQRSPLPGPTGLKANPGPRAHMRWICTYCAIVSGIEDPSCLGCGKPRYPRKANEKNGSA